MSRFRRTLHCVADTVDGAAGFGSDRSKAQPPFLVSIKPASWLLLSCTLAVIQTQVRVLMALTGGVAKFTMNSHSSSSFFAGK